MTHNEKIVFMIKYLIAENPMYANMCIPTDKNKQFRLFRSLVNIRLPKSVDDNFLSVQNKFLQEEITTKEITDISDLQPVQDNIYLWKGDITTLKCGAIVNAANSQMLGCFCPCHGCIDNAIHTFSGIQLRQECEKIMQKQGHDEPTGQAKITSAYNLPCDYIIHTVGPIVNDRLTENHCELLKSCYQNCLKLAMQNGIKSIAFCCISTGEFHFPNHKAAEIAVETVQEFLKQQKIEVIFNVFKQTDYEIYKQLLG